MKNQYQYKPAPDYERVKEALLDAEVNAEEHHHRKRKNPVNVDKMSIKDIYLIEAFASKMTKEMKIKVHSVDLMFLLWARDFEYFSRGFVVKSLMFLTIFTSFVFFQRNKKNKFVTEVRTRSIGMRNGSSYYLSHKGQELAERMYQVFKTGKITSF